MYKLNEFRLFDTTKNYSLYVMKAGDGSKALKITGLNFMAEIIIHGDSRVSVNMNEQAGE